MAETDLVVSVTKYSDELRAVILHEDRNGREGGGRW